MKIMVLILIVPSLVWSLELADFHEKLSPDIKKDSLNDHKLHNREPSRSPASVKTSKTKTDEREHIEEQVLKNNHDQINRGHKSEW